MDSPAGCIAYVPLSSPEPACHLSVRTLALYSAFLPPPGFEPTFALARTHLPMRLGLREAPCPVKPKSLEAMAAEPRLELWRPSDRLFDTSSSAHSMKINQLRWRTRRCGLSGYPDWEAVAFPARSHSRSVRSRTNGVTTVLAGAGAKTRGEQGHRVDVPRAPKINTRSATKERNNYAERSGITPLQIPAATPASQIQGRCCVRG